MRTDFPSKYPPKNRMTKSIAAPRIEINDCIGLRSYDANSLTAAIANHEAREWRPFGRVSSDITPSHAAVIYRSDDVELHLRPDEIERMVMRRLTPTEFFALAGTFGVFFEIHSDFYDEDTGKALQPR